MASAAEQLVELTDMIHQKRAEIFSGAAPGVDPDHYIGSFLQAIRRNLDLLNCTKTSLFLALSNSAMLGLCINSIDGDGYLVPRNRSVKHGSEWTKINEAHFQSGYQGKLKLLYESPFVAAVNCEVVREGDAWEIFLGSVQRIDHIPANTRRGAILGAYCVIKTSRGGHICTWMTIDEILDHAKKFSGTWSTRDGAFFKSSAWSTNPEGMAKKTVFIKANKFAPGSDRARRLNQIEDHIAHGVDVEPRRILNSGDTQADDDLDALAGVPAGEAEPPIEQRATEEQATQDLATMPDIPF